MLITSWIINEIRPKMNKFFRILLFFEWFLKLYPNVEICEVIKRNESYVENIDFEIYPIMIYSLIYANPFVSYCFQLGTIAYIFGTKRPILIGFSAKQSSLIALPIKLKNWNLICPDIRLILLDRITYVF